MRLILLAGAAVFGMANAASAQIDQKELDQGVAQEVVVGTYKYLIGDIVVAKGVQVESAQQVETIDVILPTALEGLTLAHPAEILNSVAGVNIHRGSGQEHLTAIRSPVLTGGAGAGSFLYALDGVPLRAAGFANVNGLLEAPTEIASRIEVFKGPGPADYGSNAVH